MKALLLPVLLLSLGAALQAQDDPLSFPEGEANFEGIWYTMAVVTGRHGPEMRHLRKSFPTTVTLLENGDLEAKSFFMIKGRCQEIKFVMQKTETPGKYSAYNGKKSVYIKALPVKDYYIIYCEDQEKNFGIGKLVGSTPEENPEALEEFRKFTKSKGLPEKNIFVPEQKENCNSESD